MSLTETTPIKENKKRKMKVGMYYNNNDVRVENMPIPEIGDDEILVKVMSCGICGSDVMEWYRIKKAPLVLGHETTGRIEKVGERVKKNKKFSTYKVGERVFISHHVSCQKCKYCKDDHFTVCEMLRKTNFYPGGFAEYVRIPFTNIEKGGVLVLPENISYDEGTFIEPLGCVIRAQRAINLYNSENKKDAQKNILVIGCGISGLLHIKLLAINKKKGKNNKNNLKIIGADINEYRLNKAIEFGADEVINVKEIDVKKDRTNTLLADYVIVCTGAASATETAFNCIDRGGKIMFFAVPKPDVKFNIPINEFWKNEITIKTSYAASINDLAEALKLLNEGKISVRDMITHKLNLDEISYGFKVTAEAKDSIKVIINLFRTF